MTPLLFNSKAYRVTSTDKRLCLTLKLLEARIKYTERDRDSEVNRGNYAKAAGLDSMITGMITSYGVMVESFR